MNTSFNIYDAARYLNQAGDYYAKEFDRSGLNWVFIKPVNLLGRDENVEINVIIKPEENLVIFIMPLYGDGSQGLTGSVQDIAVFDSAIHTLNSRTKGGYLTKYTYDDSYAPVFMHQLPLNRMDLNWFKATLDYCINILIGFRPTIDRMIYDFNLRFDSRAGLNDSGRKYLIDSANKQKSITGF